MPDWALLSNDLDARNSRGLVDGGEAGSMSDHSLFVLVLPQLLTATSSYHSTLDFGQVVYGTLPLRQKQSVPSSRERALCNLDDYTSSAVLGRAGWNNITSRPEGDDIR